VTARGERAAAWVYAGVWRLLVDLLRVPADPPTLPAREGERLASFRPAEGYLRYRKFYFWIALILIDAVFTALWIATFFVHWLLGVAMFPVWVLLAIVPDIFAYIAVHVRYDTMWYVHSDRSVRIRRGIWSIHETTITFENVQNVTVRQGPIQRHFGIADVIIETAGGGGAAAGAQGASVGGHIGLIEGVGNAAEIRDLIMDKVRRSRSAGLGEEVSERGEWPGAGWRWSKQHIAELRALRDELAACRLAAMGAGT